MASSVEAAYGLGAEGDDDVEDDGRRGGGGGVAAGVGEEVSERTGGEDLEEDPATGRLRVTTEVMAASARETGEDGGDRADAIGQGMIRFLYVVTICRERRTRTLDQTDCR